MAQDMSDFVKRARAKLGLSQTDFGAKLGVNRQTVGRYETPGHALPEVARLAIARLLDEHKRKRK